MTIAIGAIGKNAGLAVWKALNSVEKVTSGSIGGFATFTIIGEDGKTEYYCTQRGGSRTLFTSGDSVSTYPPETVIKAPIAGVISSGPDRMEPLSDFLVSEDNVGLVTGHRIPQAIGVNGLPVNIEVLKLMKKGIPANVAIEMVMSHNPNVDAGLIAIDLKGNCGIMNSIKVENRIDAAKAIVEKDDAKVMVLNNEIYPVKITADLAAAIAIQVMSEERKPDFQISIDIGLKVQHGPDDKVVIDENNRAIEVFTTDSTILKGRVTCVVPYLGSIIVKNNKIIGKLMNEPITILDNGKIMDLAGQKTIIRDVEGV